MNDWNVDPDDIEAKNVYIDETERIKPSVRKILDGNSSKSFSNSKRRKQSNLSSRNSSIKRSNEGSFGDDLGYFKSVTISSNLASIDSKYDIFLNFLDSDDTIQYNHFLKTRIYPPSFWAFTIIITIVTVPRMNLQDNFFQGPVFILYFVCIYVIFVGTSVILSMKLSEYTYGKIPQDNLAANIAKQINKYIFFGEAESVLCILSAIAATLQLVGRVLVGVCPDNITVWRSVTCNTQALSLAPPSDTVILAYVTPLMLQTCTKGISKWILILSWAIVVVAVTWSIIYLEGYNNIFMILFSVIPLMIGYDVERTMMSVFLTSKYTLLAETGKRKITEIELKNVERADKDRIFALQHLPLHSAIINGVDKSSLLMLIKEHLSTAKRRDYDGKTAFDLVLERIEIDQRAFTELLIDSLPINAVTEQIVDPCLHDYAWTRAVQYERNIFAVRWVLSQYPEIATELAFAEDPEGRYGLYTQDRIYYIYKINICILINTWRYT
jgi:hypothetical protein